MTLNTIEQVKMRLEMARAATEKARDISISNEQDKADIQALAMMDETFFVDVYNELIRGAGYYYMLYKLAEQTSDTPEELLESLKEQVNTAITEKNELYDDIISYLDANKVILRKNREDGNKKVHLEEKEDKTNPDSEFTDEAWKEIVEEDNEEEESTFDVKEEEPQKVVSMEFDCGKYWKQLGNEQKQSISRFIQQMAAGGINKDEAEMLNVLAGGLIQTIEEAVEASASALRARASIDSLIEKGAVRRTGKSLENIYLTQAGALLYTAMTKKNPMIFWNNETKKSSFSFD